MLKQAYRLLQRTMLLVWLMLLTQTALAQNATVRGTIKDAAGLPLQGASVAVEGTKRGVLTDVNGNFVLNLKPGNYTLVISYVGQQTQRQTIDVPAGGLSGLSYGLQHAGDLNRIVVVGSRSATQRTATTTVAPVDVISARDLQATGQIEPTQMLNFVAPSFNSSRQTVADGTDHIDPATLRGLGPDQVLVLVNGRRRYNTALLNVNGTIGRGSVGTDLNSIPPEAIERIEVLRDGAASQYGSDAIGGVINIVLKKNTKGTTIFSHAGKHFAGDGATGQIGITQGFGLGKEGYLTISADLRHREPTNRVGDYRGRVYVSDSLYDEQLIRERGFSRKNNMAIGNSELDNAGFVVNAGTNLSANTQFFLTGSMNWRDGRAAGFYRYPSQTSQVIAELYPDGFLPFINSTIKDRSIIAGLQGKIGAGWNWDVSQTAGGNSFAFDITNTNNASQFALGRNAPTNFYAGTLAFNQYVTNVNFSKDLSKKIGWKSFNFATGAELRFDNYQIQQGEEASWRNYTPNSGRVGGAQVFPGFQPANAVDETRNVQGVYVDLEGDVNDKFLANVAGRFENYSDFGSNFAGKLAMRYKLAGDKLALRATLSNGFRAPSMHQRYFSSVATVFISNGSTLVPVQNGTFRNSGELAKSFGIPSLEAEKSMNYSAGLTSRLGGFSITVDGYLIDISDRIVLTGTFTKSSPIVAQLLANYPEVNSAAFFTNAIDTRTRGLDVVIARSMRLEKGNLNLTLAANFNETEVTKNKGLSGPLASDTSLNTKVLFDREQETRIERGQPRSKIAMTLNYSIGRFNLVGRVTRFGEVATADRLNPGLDETFNSRFVTDASLGVKISDFASLTIGANNIGNVYPERLENYGNTSLGRFIYSRAATQFGFNGGYYYASLMVELQNLIRKK